MVSEESLFILGSGELLGGLILGSVGFGFLI